MDSADTAYAGTRLYHARGPFEQERIYPEGIKIETPLAYKGACSSSASTLMLWCVASDFKKDGSLKFVRDSPNRPSIPSYGRVAIASESERFQRLSKSRSMQNLERMPSVALVAKEWTTTVRA